MCWKSARVQGATWGRTLHTRTPVLRPAPCRAALPAQSASPSAAYVQVLQLEGADLVDCHRQLAPHALSCSVRSCNWHQHSCVWHSPCILQCSGKGTTGGMPVCRQKLNDSGREVPVHFVQADAQQLRSLQSDSTRSTADMDSSQQQSQQLHHSGFDTIVDSFGLCSHSSPVDALKVCSTPSSTVCCSLAAQHPSSTSLTPPAGGQQPLQSGRQAAAAGARQSAVRLAEQHPRQGCRQAQEEMGVHVEQGHRGDRQGSGADN